MTRSKFPCFLGCWWVGLLHLVLRCFPFSLGIIDGLVGLSYCFAHEVMTLHWLVRFAFFTPALYYYYILYPFCLLVFFNGILYSYLFFIEALDISVC
jgi:hypothetical protein